MFFSRESLNQNKSLRLHLELTVTLKLQYHKFCFLIRLFLALTWSQILPKYGKTQFNFPVPFNN